MPADQIIPQGAGIAPAKMTSAVRTAFRNQVYRYRRACADAAAQLPEMCNTLRPPSIPACAGPPSLLAVI
jgi:hypothetical protein